jgi:hypothetical protein
MSGRSGSRFRQDLMSVYRRGDRWQVLIDLDRGVDGKRRRGSLGSFPTKKEAERAEREALSSRDRGIDLSPNTVTVAEMISRYLSDANSRCGGKTMERYRELASNYIEPHLGSIVLSKLRPAHISAFNTTLLERGGAKGRPLSPKTVRHGFALLKSALAWAVRMQLAGTNPASVVKPPHAARPTVRAFSAEEIALLLDAAA